MAFERDMADELAFHMEARTQDLIRSGVPEAEARRRARVEFGGVEGWKERCRETRSFRPLDELRADVRYGLRTLAKSPGFTIVAILSLGIGVGVNTGMFSLIDALWLRPMAVPDEGRVTRLFTTSPQKAEDSLSWPEFEAFQQQARSFTGIIAEGGRGTRMQRPDGTFELLTLSAVSTNFFTTLGVSAAAGRVFTPQDEPTLTAHPVVVLGNSFWQKHYGGDRSVVGRQIALEGGNGQMLFTVLGVLPDTFREIDPQRDRDIWMPPQTFSILRGHGDFEERGFRWFDVLGRIRPGVSIKTATAEARTIAARLAAAWPATNRGRSARAMSDFDYRMEQGRGPGTIFLGVVLLVMLMSAVNVANLLIARAAARTQEFSVRLAVGAARGRLFRQMFTESVLLGFGGLAAGIALGWAFIRALPAIIGEPPGYHLSMHIDFDLRVFLFGAALTVATTLLFGFTPSLGAARSSLNSLLRQGSDPVRRGHFRARHLLISVQVALSLTLLAMAAVLIASFVRISGEDIGIARRELLLLWCAGGDRNVAGEAIARLRALPGVQDVAVGIRAPLSLDEGGMARRVSFPGRPEIDRAAPLEIKYNAISANFLRVFGTPIVHGRDFNELDQTTGPPVVLVSQTMAGRYWPGQDAVGKTIRIGEPPGTEHRVIGVVKDVPFNSIGQRPEPYMYLPWWRSGSGEATFILPTRVPALTLADVGRRTVIAVDRRLDPFTISTEEQLIRFSAIQQRLTAEMLSLFGTIGLILTAIGLYGVVAWTVARRTREIGIRMALGASRGETTRLVLRQTAIVGGIGMLVGVPLSLAATKASSELLYGTSPWDPGMLATAVGVLAVVLLVAGFIPAGRATRIDPMKALRVE